jgi:nuclear transport factor 2 (NTF2) superfamily protein
MEEPEELTRECADGIVHGVLLAFRSRNIDLILEGFTDDAEVLFGPMDVLRGRGEIERFLKARFDRQLNYRLEKDLRMVDGAKMAVAWRGWWDDAITGVAMRGKGVEIWTIRGGRIARWEAAFTTVQEGQDPAQALGIL